MHSLKNALLEISIHPTGAELQKITSTKHHLDFMWDGDPDVWSGHSPNLFPIVGALKNDAYLYENKTYHLPKHGFVRHNKGFSVADESEDHVTFELQYSEDTLSIYPFKFEFLVTYKLIENTIKVTYTIKNKDDKLMYFSIGGHPAFKCPVFPDEKYQNYCLNFDHPESSLTHMLNLETGLFNGETETVFKGHQSIPLHHDLFDKDALVFKDLKSRKVTLESEKYGRILSVSFDEFPYLGIWAKTNGNFVCIEPWQGLADYEDTNQTFKDKEGIVALKEGDEFVVSYSIEIDERHLT